MITFANVVVYNYQYLLEVGHLGQLEEMPCGLRGGTT